jgi:hypothetical protein
MSLKHYKKTELDEVYTPKIVRVSWVDFQPESQPIEKIVQATKYLRPESTVGELLKKRRVHCGTFRHFQPKRVF